MNLPKVARASFLGLTLAATVWPQTPVIKSETRLVTVDVVVTGKKGAYIRDLSAKDFHVWEDGKEQPVRSFALESSSPAGASSEPHYVVLFFDYGAMDGAAQLRARQTGAQFIDANTGPDRKMAVVNFDAGLRITQSFTENTGRLKEAVTGAKAADVAVNNAASGSSASGDLGARARLDALKKLALELRQVPGRKTIILFTGSLIGKSNQKSPLLEAIDACNEANVAVYPVDVRDSAASDIAGADSRTAGGATGPGPLGSQDPYAGMRPRTKGDTDSSSPAPDSTAASQEVLNALANGTDGFLIRSAAELPSGLQKIAQEQQEYYLLGYTPPASKAGACHELKVKVDRSGATLRARSSYCDAKADGPLLGSAAEQKLKERAGSAGAGNVAASMRLPFFYSGPDAATVHVAMEIELGAIKFQKKGGKLHADVNVLGIAASADGSVGSRFNDAIPLDFDEADPSWKTKPLHYEQQLKVAPGQYTFTVAFSAGGESFGKLEQPLTVEPRPAGQLAMSSLALGKETRKVAASPLQSLFGEEPGLSARGVQLIPTGLAAFSANQPVFCYLEVYPGGESGGPVSVELLIRNAKTGEQVGARGGQKADAPAGGAAIPMGLTVPIAGLAPGSYRLEAVATDAAGHSVRRAEPFELR